MAILSFPLGFITLTSVVAVDTMRLNNGRGQTPCCVAQQLVAPCQESVSRDCENSMRDIDVILGSACTCNTVVFNLWSGCLETRNEPTPNFNMWIDSCHLNRINVTYNDYPLHDIAVGAEIPTWAYINLSGESAFDFEVAMSKARGWTTAQVLLPITLGMLALGVLGALYFYYRRRMHKLPSGEIRSHTSWLTLSSYRRLMGIRSGTQERPSNTYRKSWAIDDFETAIRRQSIESEDGQHGSDWLTPTPRTPPPEYITQRLQQYIKSSRSLWKNPFKKQPVKVVSLSPRKGFRVGDPDVSTSATNSRRPTLEPYDGLGNDANKKNMSGWSTTNGEEIFDARDEGLDENSVLLISRAPGVNFSTASPTMETVIIPSPPPRTVESPEPQTPLSPDSHPSQTLKRSHPPSLGSHSNYPMENIVRPTRTDSVMLFPASVHAAGYIGVPTSHFINESRTSPNNMPLTIPMMSSSSNNRR